MRENTFKTPSAWPLHIKIKRRLWEIVWFLLFRPTPKRLANGWRIALLKFFGAEVGAECYVLGSVKVLQPWHLRLGSGVTIGNDVDVYNFTTISIGDRSVISQRTFLCTGSHDYTEDGLPLTYEPIAIGEDCWVASECFVGPGINIDDGAVIAARSVVTRDMPAWMICAGHPCKPLKPRVMKSSDAPQSDWDQSPESNAG